MAAGDVKPDIKSEPITITLKDGSGDSLMFKVKPTTRFEKILSTYATKRGVAAESIRLLYEGERIQADQTPEQLKIKEGDEINVMLEQTGGA